MRSRVKNISNQKYSLSLPILAVAISIFVSSMLSGVILLLASFVLSSTQTSPYSFMNLLTMGTQVISSLLGGVIAAGIYKKRGLIIGAVCGIIFFVLMLASGVVFFNKSFYPESILTGFIVMVSGAIGGLLGNKKR